MCQGRRLWKHILFLFIFKFAKKYNRYYEGGEMLYAKA